MPRRHLLLLWLLLLAIPAFAVAQDDPFQSGVRPTDPLSPAEAQAAFELPPGFEIQLVAAEPDILKPLNMAFDARGRLWVTTTQEYPFAAPADREPRDELKILEDTNGDGRADKIITFADKLNIPIGVYPYKNGAIVFGIPHIWFLEDTDGDDVADRRTRLYGPMGYERDTHGMNNAFRRGFDGWLYACHGFNNVTDVAGTDGHQVHMESGNTYRMRLDGSRIEQFTWGQVNPFGMTFDPLFNIFTADCHSKPITDLLRSGYYQSFGKPHDGLGFVPEMMDHFHGSTAISGIVHYAAEQFPAEYRGNLFSGNVMTSRVNRNSLEYHGATMRCVEREDFLKTSDPWFRPADLRLGPDGALYIADFYNRIIGHYEVPLGHPGRDRTSGRIWRIVYTGEQPHEEAAHFDFSSADVAALVQQLGSKNLTRRLTAMDELTDRYGQSAAEPVAAAAEHSSDPLVRLHAMWVLHRLNALNDNLLEINAHNADSALRVHVMKVLAERTLLSNALAQVARRGLQDEDAFVRRAAADALAQHPEHHAIDDLLDCLVNVPPEDGMLRHGVRIALRNQLSPTHRLQETMRDIGDERLLGEVSSVARGIATAEASEFLVQYLSSHSVPAEQATDYLRHAANHAVPQVADQLVELARRQFADSPDQQVALLDAVARGLEQQNATITPKLREWALELAQVLLAAAGSDTSGWTTRPLTASSRREAAWTLETRRLADGNSAPMLSTLPSGEQRTGALRSPAFEAPRLLSFYLAGHSGFPDKPLTPLNYVRLCDAATGEVLLRAAAPRNDTAQLVEWDLDEFAGRRVYFEAIDADDAGAYAWLAVGDFAPPVITVPDLEPAATPRRLASAAAIVSRFQLTELLTELQSLLLRQDLDPVAAGAIAAACIRFQPAAAYEALAAAIASGELPAPTELLARQRIVERSDQDLDELFLQIMQSVPAQTQLSIATALAGDRSGAVLLLDVIRSGRASPRLLQAAAVAQRFQAIDDGELLHQVAELTADVPPVREELDRLVAERRREFFAAPRAVDKGADVFNRSCITCHQLSGKGAMVGPQLDGIGNRGLDRLLEDLLDPHRNVDIAFRTTTLVLTDGKVVSGLLRREEGTTLVLVDDQGKEFTVDSGDVDEQLRTNLSLMPENVATSLPPEDFHNLMAFLLAQRGESGAE